jgi:argininosuccinate lyase
VEEYTTSLPVDRRLAGDDIELSQAYARMLKSVGLLASAEQRQIDAGLRDIRREIEAGTFVFDDSDEEIQSAVERGLTEKIGAVAGKLHAGRSRNDQGVTALRMWCKRTVRELMLETASLQEALLRRAQEHRHTVMPGYTHNQRAQVVSLAHHLLAYVEMLQRDVVRFETAHDRCDVMSLGSGALAASTLPLDRRVLAELLGFDSISANSMDSVADRDFVVDIVSACTQLMVHVSRMSEDVVLWSSSEYGFAELPDAYATGSSIMPQKKNPDIFELARGRTGQVIGSLVALLTLTKALPLTYSRDLQEDKPALFNAVDVTMPTLQVLTEAFNVIGFNIERMREAASDPSLAATDVAEYLVLRGVPFREAHTLVGRAVARTGKRGRTLTNLSAGEWRELSERFDEDVVELFDLDSMLGRRETQGGPGPKAVSRHIVRAATMVAKTRRLVPVLAKQATVAKEVGEAKAAKAMGPRRSR